MLSLYNLGIHCYHFSIKIASLFSSKAKLWIDGRKKIFIPKTSGNILIHCASLGEFEQGKPLIDELIKKDYSVIVSFFSPSGYEVINKKGIYNCVYLPIDTKQAQEKFINNINPKLIILVKYEFWINLIRIARQNNIQVISVSSVFRSNQIYFKGIFSSFFKRELKKVNHFFVQDEGSKKILLQNNISQVSVSGDLRYKRVLDIKNEVFEDDCLNDFTNGAKILIAGSTWKKDIEMLAQLELKDYKFIIAPHEINDKTIQQIESSFPDNISFSKYSKTNANVLIIDNFGMLSKLYRYADLAYVGGGFGVGIHNTLEAAVYGKPVFFGPNNKKFLEVQSLKQHKIGFEVDSNIQMEAIINSFDEEVLNQIKIDSELLFQSQKDSLEKIISNIRFK